MSVKQVNLTSLLVQEYFGEAARAVHDELRWGPKTLRLMSKSLDLPLASIKRSLCMFIQYGFVTFEGNKSGIAEYTLMPEKILLTHRYPKYLSLVNRRYSESSKDLVEAVLKHGRITASNAILQAWEKMKSGTTGKFNNKVAGLQDCFNELVSKQYLIKCPQPENDLDRVPNLVTEESRLHEPVQLNLQKLISIEKGETTDNEDTVFWRCNFDRFHQDLRDEIMTNSIRQRFNIHAGKLMDVLLRLSYLRTHPWATQSNPIPIVEIRDYLEKEKSDPVLVQHLELHLKILEEFDTCQFIRRTTESASASVIINFASAFTSLAASTIESIIEFRFGHKAVRIFRLVRSKVYIDQEQMQKIAMIPDKEAKHIAYKLIEESFLNMSELKKSVSAGPVKHFYLFHVNFNQVCQVVLDMCYKTVSNIIYRTSHEKNVHFRLIEKFEKLAQLATSMREQNQEEAYIQEVMDELVSPPEKTLLASVESMIQKFQVAEINLDDTMLIMELYTYYESCKILEKKK